MQYYSDITQNWQNLPTVDTLLPYGEEECQRIRETFYNKYYNDSTARQLWLGINPGRHGAGITGIPFSDPLHLHKYCGLNSSWDKKAELSAEFIFEVINEAGGPKKFYNQVFIDSICPVGFTKNGLNFNYYDESSFFKKIKPHLHAHMEELGSRPLKGKVVIIGKGKNEKHYKRLNTPFESYTSLPHPRWIMQYRRKDKLKWVEKYLEVLGDN